MTRMLCLSPDIAFVCNSLPAGIVVAFREQQCALLALFDYLDARAAGRSVATTGCQEGLMLHSDGSSVHGGSLLLLGPGDPLGEMAFFTETSCFEVGVGAQSVCMCFFWGGGRVRAEMLHGQVGVGTHLGVGWGGKGKMLHCQCTDQLGWVCRMGCWQQAPGSKSYSRSYIAVSRGR